MFWSKGILLEYLHCNQPLDKHQFKMKIAAELANRINKHKLRFTIFSFVGHHYIEEWASI